jgi:regulator of extracellular matrix RemA (YlzA/DUF370 family)
MIQLLDVGFGNMVSANRIIAIIDPESAPIKRIITTARENQTLVDVTMGRKTRAVIITDTSAVILSAIQPETIANRLIKINNGASLHSAESLPLVSKGGD